MIVSKKDLSIFLCIIFLSGIGLISPIQSDEILKEDDTTPPDIILLNSERSKVKFNVSLNGFHVENEEIHGEIYHKVSIPGYGFLDYIGKPKLPAMRLFFAVPPEIEDIQVNVLTSEYRILNGYNIIPVQIHSPESESNDNFTINTSTYYMDDFYPQQIVYTESQGWIRDYQYIQITLSPLQFNACTHELKVHDITQIEIQYNGTAEGLTTTINTGFDELYQQLFLNFETSTDWYIQIPEGKGQKSRQNTSDLLNTSNRAGCLIITHDSFYDCIQNFAAWKNRKGWETFIANTSLIYTQFPTGTNRERIQNFINYTFTNWEKTPSHVLLIGDVEYIPTYYYQGDTPSDHWYSCIIGNDYFSDVLVGRISVKNSAELTNIVEKIINYEKNPYLNETDWYKKAMLVSDSGYFETTSNWIFNFLNTFNYSCDKFYYSQGTATQTNIANALNDGRAIANYRGHGSTTGWQTGSFYNSNVLTLNNGRKLPIVISPTCSTGHYDDPNTDCYGEVWLKAPDKGGVSFWGSSRVSYGGYNDELSMGVYKAIFNDQIHDFGGFTNKAKIYMTDVYGMESMAILELHLFNVIGDSTLEFWTDVPQQMNITYPTAVPSANPSYFVTVKNDNDTPLEDACVVLEKLPDIYLIDYTNESGKAVFNLENVTPGTIHITVTKHNCIPFLGNTSVYNVMSLTNGWNFISFPFNQTINKQNITVRHNQTSYDWQQAVSSNLVGDFIFDWDRTIQSYVFSDSIHPGHGCWVYSFEHADLWVHSTRPFDDHITTLATDWNTIGLPYYQNQSKNVLLVENSSLEYTWAEAVTLGLINNYVFGWDITTQSYFFSEIFEPGGAYWLYAYQPCTLKRNI